MRNTNLPELGQIVRIVRGQLSGICAIVTGVADQRSVWLADGRKRKLEQPKKKNVIHLERLDDCQTEIASRMQEGASVTNAMLRRALMKYRSPHLTEDREKGE